MGNGPVEDGLFLIAGGRPELPPETRAILTPTQLDEISGDTPQLPLTSLVGAEILQQRVSKRNRAIPPFCTRTLLELVGTVHWSSHFLSIMPGGRVWFRIGERPA